MLAFLQRPIRGLSRWMNPLAFNRLRSTRFEQSRRAIPLFHAVPMRARADAWTPLRQAEFIGRYAGVRRKPDKSALLRLLALTARGCGAGSVR